MSSLFMMSPCYGERTDAILRGRYGSVAQASTSRSVGRTSPLLSFHPLLRTGASSFLLPESDPIMRTFSTILTAVLAIAPFARADDKSDFFFKDADRIVFLGDSITEQYQYSTDLELYLTTRFPKWRLVFLNAGIGGDTANGGAGRFTNHV